VIIENLCIIFGFQETFGKKPSFNFGFFIPQCTKQLNYYTRMTEASDMFLSMCRTGLFETECSHAVFVLFCSSV
jgi:hypothetical protein